tara:strand:- start:233 stop:472 length:240 start_codon:yes stop_codon:yes gene_type:complete
MKKKMKSKGYAKGGAKMMKAMGGKMMKSKGYAKGGTKMMKAMGGKMAKGYSKGGAKMMSVTDMRRMAKMKGYDLVKKKS